ncbi:MAG: response regulator transcription factor [Candidatus Omnitrophica bacterium]|nr:response regulator transcription factor [Candidatus Omnitrophota bacterium]
MRILIIEDEKRVAGFMRRSLLETGYAVDCAYDGQEGLEFAQTTPYDAIILDLMLPKRDGLSLLKTLRQRGVATPVLAVTAKGTVHDRVTGLNSGCDDYLVKPFAVVELVARVRSLLRRGMAQTAALQVDDLILNTTTHTVTRAGKAVTLTAKEFALLEYLMRNAGQVLTKTMIEQHVWNYDFDSGTNLVEVHMSHLRNKVNRGLHPALIETVRGVGYVLREPPGEGP